MDNPIAKIDLGNIIHNVNIIKTKVNNSKILAVVKSNAYGHGAVKIASELDKNINISAFGVSRFPEAIEIYNYGIKKPILLLEGVINKNQLIQCANNNFIVTIGSFEQLELINTTSLDKKLSIWLKFNTGMNRLGFEYSDSVKIINKIDDLIKKGKLNSNYVVMTHLSNADNTTSDYTNKQLQVFEKIIEQNKLREKPNVELSAANSAGIFAWPDSHFDWVRPGISLFGSSPIINKSRNDLDLKPSIELTTKVISLKIIKEGDIVGYNCRWQAQKDSLIAIIAFGYGDGYPKLFNDQSYVFINNKKCNIVGSVSMDMIAVDCSDFNINEINIGESVEVWGSHINIDDVARNHQTISYDIFCKTTSRVERVYI